MLWVEGGEQPDQLAGVVEKPIVLLLLRRLGTHEAVVIATLSQKHAVHRAALAPKHTEVLPGLRCREDIASRQVPQ